MKTRRILLSLITVSLSLTLSAQKENKGLKVEHDTISADSTEYDLIVFDQGFDSWFQMQPQQSHSLEYYRSKNRLYVTEWNLRYMNPARYGNLYESYIDYDPDTDYGIDLERKLFYYFRYFETTNGISLLLPGR